MRHTRRTVHLLPVLALAMAFAAEASAQAAPDNRPGFAVFHFAYGGSFGRGAENLEQMAVGIQQMLMTELSINTSLRVVDRAQLRSYMEEVDLGERVDPATAARIGRIVGARYAFVGGFIENNGQLRIDGRIVNVETTEVVKAEQIQGNRDEIFRMMTDFAALVTRGVDLPALPEQAREARRERSKLPAEAARIYSAALVAQDEGRRDTAIELYQQLATKFPDFEEPQQALRQLRGGL